MRLLSLFCLLMNRISFLFLSLLLLSFAGLSGNGTIDIGIELAISGVLIALVGIPHGAIDHIITTKGRSVSKVDFYAFYLGLIAVYTILWLMFPRLCLAAFLAISAFHFGQSQFSHYPDIPQKVKTIMATAWGVTIISSLVFFNHGQIAEAALAMADVAYLMPVFDLDVHKWLFGAGTAITLVFMMVAWNKGWLTGEKVLFEIYLLGLICLCFYLLPVLLGFTLYFTVLHSLKVMEEEYMYLRKQYNSLPLGRFILLFLPFTLLSFIGMGLLTAVSLSGLVDISVPVLILVAISVLTLPHSVVMNGFYERLYPAATVPDRA